MGDEDDMRYDLVMPFLPVRSNDGPFDDDAYVAGYEMGLLDATLSTGRIFPEEGHPIHADNREQADLIAMRHGYNGEFTNSSDGWTHMKVHQAETDGNSLFT